MRQRIALIESVPWWLGPAVVFSAGLLLFAPSFGASFASLDFNHLDAMRNTPASAFFGRIFDPGDGGRTLFDTGNLYRPIYYTVFWFEYQAFGLHPLPYYVLNTVLHATNGVLVWLLAWRLTRSQLASTVGALVWTFYPGYTDAVAWVSSVTDLLLVFFALSAVLLYAGALDASGRRSQVMYGASVVAALLALGAKEPGIAVIPIVAGYHVLLGDPEIIRDRRMPWRLLPFLLIPAIYFPVRYALVGNLASDENLTKFSLDIFFRNVHRFSSLVAGPLVGQEWSNVTVGTQQGAAGIALIAATVAAAVFGTRRERFLVWWYFVALAPFLIILPLWLIGRYLYLPFIGVAILAGAGIDHVARRIPLSTAGAYARPAASLALLAGVVVWFGWLNSGAQGVVTATGDDADAFVAGLKKAYPTLPDTGRLIVTDYPKSLSLYTDDGKMLRPAVRLAYDRNVDVLTRSQIEKGSFPGPTRDDVWYPATDFLSSADNSGANGLQAWRSSLQPVEGGTLVASDQVAYGPYQRTANSTVGPLREERYLAIAWVKGTETSAGDLISISLRENGHHAPETESNAFFRLSMAWQPVWVERRLASPDVSFLSVHFIKFSDAPKQDTFLFRDAQLRAVGSR